MDKTHGNCSRWTDETVSHVCCNIGGGNAWHSKHGAACPNWMPRHVERHVTMKELIAEYICDRSDPIAVVMIDNTGVRYMGTKERVMQCRIAKWEKSSYWYEENGIAYRRDIWRGKGLNVIVHDEDRI